MLERFLKIPPLNQNFKTERRLQSLNTKKNFKPEIKPIIEYLQYELYQLEAKQAKGTDLGANIRQEMRVKNAAKLFAKYISHRIRAKLVSNWERNMLYTKSQQIFCKKKMSMLTSLKVSSWACKCVFYRSEQNAKERETP